MKKVLMGLLAVSAVSFAQFPALDSTSAADNSVIFQTGQKGSIEVSATLTSTVPAVKYVVFASDNGDSITGAEQTYTLPKIILSQEEAKNRLDGVPKSVWVKRVVGAEVAPLEGHETVSFLMEGMDSFYTKHTGDVITGQVNEGRFTYTLTSVLPKTALEAIATAAFGAGGSVNEYGDIVKTDSEGVKTYFRCPKKLSAYTPTNGQLTYALIKDVSYTESNTMSPEDAGEVEKQFASEQTGTFTIKVRIEA